MVCEVHRDEQFEGDQCPKCSTDIFQVARREGYERAIDELSLDPTCAFALERLKICNPYLTPPDGLRAAIHAREQAPPGFDAFPQTFKDACASGVPLNADHIADAGKKVVANHPARVAFRKWLQTAGQSSPSDVFVGGWEEALLFIQPDMVASFRREQQHAKLREAAEAGLRLLEELENEYGLHTTVANLRAALASPTPEPIPTPEDEGQIAAELNEEANGYAT